MLLFPVILIWDIHTTCIYVIYALHIWYYSDTFEINSIISTHLPKTRLFSYNHDLRTAYIRMRRSLSSFSRIIWEDLWQNFAFHRVSMRRRHNSHIFAISRQTYLYRLSIHPTLLFSRKNDFFSKTLEFDYCVRVDLLDSTKNRKYMHIAYQVSCMLSFSARNVLECDFFETRFCFFSRIFWHQNVSVRPPLFSPILDNNMIEHVYIRNM
jgi:hypothetical protein